MALWSVVTVAHEEGRYELVLSGKDISKSMEQTGFDERVYSLHNLNFLEISHTCLHSLSEKLSNLRNLTQLSLTCNMLESIPSTIGQLHSLHFIDLSFNKLCELPVDIFFNLSQLTNLILTGNNLQTLPSVEGLKSLHYLMASNNKLKNLAVLDFASNQITQVSEDLSHLIFLKTVNLSDNQLTDISPTFNRCRKLTSLNLQNNPFKDSRLRRSANDQKSSNTLFVYLRRLDESTGKDKTKNHSKSSSSKNNTSECDEGDSTNDELVHRGPYILISRPTDDENYIINQSSKVKSGPRQCLIACTIHGIRFGSELKLKAFIRAQDEWHRDLCQMRRSATIATHDLKAIHFPLEFTLKEANSFEIHPLNRAKRVTGDVFLKQLVHEATLDRKSRKQLKFSQIYRYLNLLDLEMATRSNNFENVKIPVVMDPRGLVISIPPLSNSHDTRVTTDTHDILLEVTGINLTICKTIAEKVIEWLLDNSCLMMSGDETGPVIPQPESSEMTDGDVMKENGNVLLTDQLKLSLSLSNSKLHIPPKALVVRPIRVQDSDLISHLCSFFPSRTDLVNTRFNTIRS